jgi:hypothetical protein
VLPFGQDAFFALFEQYNRAIWPAQIVAYVLALAALALAARPMAGAGRAITAILAFAWAWNGIVYHVMFFAIGHDSSTNALIRRYRAAR